MPDSLSSSALDSKRRKSRDSSSLWTTNPCNALTSVGAFDGLFKAHYVFSLSYDEALFGFYTFIQTTVYNIDVGSTKETPRVKELRARLLREA